MAAYKILIKKSVYGDLDAIPKNDLQRIMDRIAALAANPRPHGCEKLAGQERYRIRQGHYRIVYSIEDKELGVLVVKVGHRKNVYR